MLRVLYSTLLYLLLPVALVRLCYRCLLRERDYSSLRLRQRLGFYTGLPSAPRIIVHAVSLGEVNSAVPLLHELRRIRPGYSIVLTTTTPAGLRRGQEILPAGDYCAALPYDLPDAVARFIDRVKPELMVIMENEVWPNLLTACARRSIAVAIVNARLSPSSMVGYRRWRLLFSPVLQKLNLLAAQDEMAATAWRQLGVANVQVCGNLKYDALPEQTSLQQQAVSIARELDIRDRRVWIAASTHPGEEEHVLSACLKVRASCPEALLIWAPRHPWRGDTIANKCYSNDLQFVRRSSGGNTTGVDVLLLDTLGELQFFYAIAELAFVGGSLTANGGHNVLEPAAAGVPVICGPHTFNFSKMCAELEQAGAMLRVYNGNSLAEAVQKLFAADDLRRTMTSRAHDYIADHSGASVATGEALAGLLPPVE